MIDELRTLLSYVNDPKTIKSAYLKAIAVDNCLGKRSVKTRILTFKHLTELYSLDPNVFIFQALLYLWNRDTTGQPLLVLLCAYSRDPLLRLTASFILKHSKGNQVSREVLENFIDSMEPGRFSKATLKSTAQNINSSWTKTGHLSGRAKKVRSSAEPTPDT